MPGSLYNFFSVKFKDTATNKNLHMAIPVFEWMNIYSLILSLSIGIIASLSIIKLYPNSGITNEFAVFIEVVIAFLGASALLSLTRLFFVYSRYKKNKY